METLNITVAFADKNCYKEIPLVVASGTTLLQAIILSEITAHFPAIDIDNVHRVGIFGKLKSPSELVQSGDRIEIYRPLHRSPMEARLNRASHEKQHHPQNKR